MKKNLGKWIGLGIILLVVAVVTIWFLIQQRNDPGEILKGFVGGEKINYLEDDEVEAILRKKYDISLDIKKAGSLDMVRADHEGRDYLFPSSQTALELYQSLHGSPYKDEILFNTPIVLYSYRTVAEALVKEGIATQTDGVYYVDMQALVVAMKEDKTWADVGLPQLYGEISIHTTNPSKSNSGNMFAGLVANMLNEGRVVSQNDIDKVLPDLTRIFGKLGYMETSSSDLWSQFLRKGMGAMPVIAGYENQLLEFSVESPEDYAKVGGEMVILYPTPTVWSDHILIALNAIGEKLMQALQDDELQKIAWLKHGFRTGVYGTVSASDDFSIEGIAPEITRIIQMPNQLAMEKLIQAFE